MSSFVLKIGLISTDFYPFSCNKTSGFCLKVYITLAKP